MRRRPTGPAVSLFPFLAVLLCAMGALILLLLLLTRQIREDTLRRVVTVSPPVATPIAEPEPVTIPTVVVTLPPPPPIIPPDPNVPLRARLAALTADRDAAAREVERLRLAVAQKKHSLHSDEAAIASSRFDIDALLQRLAARESELRDHEADRARLLDAIAQAEGTLVSVIQAAEAAEAAEPKVSIVPYDGRSGTARRPILIECTGETIRFVPESVELTAADLEGFPPDANPLLAGVVALRAHWSAIDGPGSPKPYVLLLVREEGVAAYYAAKSLLRSLDDETGYELVTDDLNLAFPEVDPAARDACRAAVRDLLDARSDLLADAIRSRRIEPLFPSGRFEVDPLEHDPTRLPGSPLGGGGPTGQFTPPVASRRSLADIPAAGATGGLPASAGARWTGGGDSTSLARPARVDKPPVAPGAPDQTDIMPIAPNLSPAASIADRLAADARQKRTLADATKNLLDDAIAEDWPSFDRPASGKRRWGVASSTANISLERPVSVEVSGDRIVVGSQDPISLPAEVTEETLVAFVAAVEREANAWGRAPGQFYWSPRLFVTVRPGGTRHFDRLERRLRGIGLRASDRIALEPAAPAFLELSHVPAAP